MSLVVNRHCTVLNSAAPATINCHLGSKPGVFGITNEKFNEFLVIWDACIPTVSKRHDGRRQTDRLSCKFIGGVQFVSDSFRQVTTVTVTFMGLVLLNELIIKFLQ